MTLPKSFSSKGVLPKGFESVNDAMKPFDDTRPKPKHSIKVSTLLGILAAMLPVVVAGAALIGDFDFSNTDKGITSDNVEIRDYNSYSPTIVSNPNIQDDRTQREIDADQGKGGFKFNSKDLSEDCKVAEEFKNTFWVENCK